MEIVEYLFDRFSITLPIGDNHDFVLLYVACEGAHFELVRYLCESIGKDCDDEEYRDPDTENLLISLHLGRNMDIARYIGSRFKMDTVVIRETFQQHAVGFMNRFFLEMIKYFLEEIDESSRLTKNDAEIIRGTLNDIFPIHDVSPNINNDVKEVITYLDYFLAPKAKAAIIT